MNHFHYSDLHHITMITTLFLKFKTKLHAYRAYQTGLNDGQMMNLGYE